MYFDEDDAKTKWCPKCDHNNRHLLSAHCIGSGCAAWRWMSPELKQSFNYHDENQLGYCGLAGKPDIM